eukprot:jgi/Psemu1/58968/gm1.58968_g
MEEHSDATMLVVEIKHRGKSQRDAFKRDGLDGVREIHILEDEIGQSELTHVLGEMEGGPIE